LQWNGQRHLASIFTYYKSKLGPARSGRRRRRSESSQGEQGRRWLQDTSKRKLVYFSIFFTPPPVPVSPGLPEDDPTIDKNKRPGFKKLGWLKLVAGLTRKKASTRRVNRKIADSTRNQRVLFSRYLAANYNRSEHHGAVCYEQALVCLSNRDIVDASWGQTFHCKMASNCFFL